MKRENNRFVLSKTEKGRIAAHAKILELYSQGVGVEDISKAVKLSLSSVRAYLPRERPEYGQHYSKNAKIIYNWRQKKERN